MPDAIPRSLSSLPIIFMGTPAFAVASLDAMVSAGLQVVAVVTAPDRPAGRGMKLNESAVKKYALEKNIPLLQPVKLKDPEFLEKLKKFGAQLQVVVAFRMLPEMVWSMPPMGTVNLHASLLPQYRGAAPINWAVIHGEKETGLTTFKLQHDIDTGNILLQERIPIGEEETAGELHDRMMKAGAELLLKTISGLAEGSLREIPQSELTETDTRNSGGSLKHAPKLFTEDCRIHWNRPVGEVFNLVRGLSPFPGAFTEVNGKTLKIFRAKKIVVATTDPPGSIHTDQKTFIRYACTDGYLDVTELQLEGKKKMKTDEFLRGNKL